MKKLVLLGAALLSLCAVGQTARAGDDGPAYSYERPAPRYYEGRVVDHPYYCPPPPPPPVVYAPPVVAVVGFPRFHHRRHFYPYGYGYPYGYAPGVHVGIGF